MSILKVYIGKLVLLFFAVFLFCGIGKAEELIQAPCVLHISSSDSDGKLSIREIVEIAEREGIKAVILGDHSMVKIEYGIWPLQNIIKKAEVRNSIFTYGLKKYLKDVEEIQRENPGVILLPGTENAPFYYWSGNPFKKNLKLHNWDVHILTFGLEEARDYEKMPLVSNEKGLYAKFNILLAWPFILVVMGAFCLTKRQYDYKDSFGRQFGPYSRKWQVLGVFIVILGSLFLLNNFPFRELKFDQYHGYKGIGPYQNFIDYVDSKGGLTFWAHPEAAYLKERGDVEIETSEYTGYLLEAKNYTGYAVLYEGYEKVGLPGGVWDELLKQYCEGQRDKPVWAVGELDFELEGDFAFYVNELRNILLVPVLNKEEVLKALRNGRMYVVRRNGEYKITLDKFVVKDSSSENQGIMGDWVNLKGKPVIKISGFLSGKEAYSGAVKVKLIRNGVVINTFEAGSFFDIEYQDDSLQQAGYYRLEIRYPNGMLITNPVFVRGGV